MPPFTRNSTVQVFGYNYLPLGIFVVLGVVANCGMAIARSRFDAQNIFVIALFAVISFFIARVMTKVVLDDDGMHWKRLLWPAWRTIKWNAVAGCELVKYQTLKGEFSPPQEVIEVRVNLMDGGHCIVPGLAPPLELMRGIQDRIRVNLQRDGRRCMRCMQKLTLVDVNATSCSKCGEDLTSADRNWIREFHRRQASGPEA